MFQAYLEEILSLRETKCTELTSELLRWDAQAEREKTISDSVVIELQAQVRDNSTVALLYTNLIGYNAIIEINAQGGAEGKLF